MLLPHLSVGFMPAPGPADPDTGVAPSFCTPCVLGKRICGLPFSPSIEDCGGGGGGGGCTKIGPCLPIINKQLCCSLSGGCSLVDCRIPPSSRWVRSAMRSDEPGSGSGPEGAPDSENAPDTETTSDDTTATSDEPGPVRPALRLPVLSGGDEIGLGDVIKRATTGLGWKPCAGCERRARYLNRVRFTPGRGGR